MDPESRTLAPNVSTWYRRFRDHGKLAEPRPRRPRMLPLVDLCMLFLTENIDEVSSAALDSLLSKYLYSLYKELARRGLSLHSWKLFSHALPRRTCKIPLGAYCYYRDIEPPFAEDLSVYTGPLTSPTVEFISNLYIEDASCFTVSDLLTLADMRNLGVLALHAYSHIRKDEVHASPVSDRYLAQGEAIGDADLVHQGVDVSYQASITDMENDNTSGTPFLLPPKPSAYLRLSRDSGQHKVHPKRCEAWYTRDFTPTMSRVATNTTTEDKPDKRMAKPLKQTARKRQCLGDLLKY
ncbi:hypothetical protein DL546_003883 [Coniochaeta pulveracea]|uniref:Uncharacterized protein n=1 Tax=Coniochaeta pulveracea TaxID=177199 RepID=A0A420Y1R9_9PEZI|nr:hypothetical protein DL546_003883 [Coniochaeta pulveracea]